jgi:hypothetical protein
MLGAPSIVVVQNLLGLPDSTPNPHLWYKPLNRGLIGSPCCSRRTT